jgi:hypothetical protein
MYKIIFSVLLGLVCVALLTTAFVKVLQTQKIKPQEIIPIIEVNTSTRFGLKNISDHDLEPITVIILRIEEQGNYRVGQYEIDIAYANMIVEFAVYPAYLEKTYKLIIMGRNFAKTVWVCSAQKPCQIQVEAIQ